MTVPKKVSALWGPYFVAPALVQLTAEMNAAWPNRSRAVDGDIGDKHHKPPSGHCPDDEDMVRAVDRTRAGCDMQTVIRRFIADPRAHYAIHRGVIWSRTVDFQPATYHGDNPHNEHAHLQVLGGAAGMSMAPWGIFTPPTAPAHAATFVGGRDLYLTSPRMRGDDVLYVQRFIGPRRCGAADGIYGPHTDAGVRWYQRMRGIPATGHVDAQTWTHLLSR